MASRPIGENIQNYPANPRENEGNQGCSAKTIGKVALAIIFCIPMAIYYYKEIGEWTYEKVLTPITSLIQKAAVWTYETLLVPVGRAISKAAEFLFVTLPKAFYDYVLVPVATAIKSAAKWVYKHILTPIGHAISAAAKFLFVTLPVAFYDYVLVPVGTPSRVRPSGPMSIF